jgi:parvulin-like peptidyl-prolyl isomerase
LRKAKKLLEKNMIFRWNAILSVARTIYYEGGSPMEKHKSVASSVRGSVRNALVRHNYSAKSIIALILFGAIIMVFVLFDFPSRKLGSAHGGVAAQVNRTLISLSDLKNETSRLEQMYAQMFGGMDMSGQQQFIRSSALENLITMELISQHAESEGILTTDAEVRDFIVNDIAPFKEDGRFQKDRYFQYLQAVNSSADEFESKIRKERRTQRTRQVFEMSSTPLNLELDKEKRLENTKWNVQYLKLDREELTKKATQAISDSEVANFLNNTENIKKVESEFNANKTSYAKEEKVHAEHILIKSKSPSEDAKAQERVNAIKARLAKEDFSKVAQKESEDEGSKSKGGDLGFFARGAMVPEFETAAFSAKVGELVGPVKSSFGYHLIKVLEKQSKQEAQLELVKNQIAKKIIAENKVDSQLKELESALEKGDDQSLARFTQALGVNFEETGFFPIGTNTLPKLGASDALSAEIFSLKSPGQMSKKLIRDGSARYALKLKETKVETNSENKAEAATVTTDATNKKKNTDPSNKKAMALFENWIKTNKDKAKIERNIEMTAQE